MFSSMTAVLVAQLAKRNTFDAPTTVPSSNWGAGAPWARVGFSSTRAEHIPHFKITISKSEGKVRNERTCLKICLRYLLSSHAMKPTSMLYILDLLATVGVQVWRDGGWGVDALRRGLSPCTKGEIVQKARCYNGIASLNP